MTEAWNNLKYLAGADGPANIARAAQFQRAVGEMLAAGDLPVHVRRLKVACLRTVTIEPLLPLLVSAMAVQDFAVSVECGQLGNYYAEVTQADSFLHRGGFDVCLVLAPLETIAAAVTSVAAHIDNVSLEMAHFLDGLEKLSDKFPGLIVVCNFAAGQPLLARRLQSQQPQSPRYAYAEANRVLAERISARRNVIISDLAALAADAGSAAFFSPRNMATVLQPFSPAGFESLAKDWAELCRLHFRGPAKCIVLDCDDTLWGGIVGEDGVHGLKLGETYPGVCFQQIQRQLMQLKSLGFLLALNSKNNEADVRAVFEQHPGMVLKWGDFAATRVNWQDKAANMSALSAELNLGVDSFVFIDDNAFELERVRAAFPGIQTLAIPAESWKLPELLPRCVSLDRLAVTGEDRAKAEMYAQEQERRQVEEQASSADDYLARLGLKMTIESYDPARHAARAVQLLQKTNQFNLTTRRYTEKDLQEMQSAGALICLASLADQFGDYGRIALAIVRLDGSVPELDTFLMSCRAIGRKAESVLLGRLLDKLKRLGFHGLRASFIATERNQVSAGFLPEHGFQLVGSTALQSCYERDTSAAFSAASAYYEEVHFDEAFAVAGSSKLRAGESK